MNIQFWSRVHDINKIIKHNIFSRFGTPSVMPVVLWSAFYKHMKSNHNNVLNKDWFRTMAVNSVLSRIGSRYELVYHVLVYSSKIHMEKSLHAAIAVHVPSSQVVGDPIFHSWIWQS
jgi:hypothetical protein